jgi:Flp pilus assembly protein TadD
MSRGWKRIRVKGSDPEDGARREEQGDLLADAVSGAFRGDEPLPEEDGGAGEPDDLEEAAPQEVTPPGQGEASEVEGGAPELAEGREPVPESSEGAPAAEAAMEATPPKPAGEDLAPPMEDAVSEPAERADPEAAEEGEPAPGPIPLSPWEQKMAWAKERAREGRLADAEELYRELLQEDPDSVRARNNLGILLDERGDHQGAVAELQIARQLEPKNGEVLGNLGAALGAMGRYVEAEDALRAAHRLDPSNLEIRANLGILYFRKGLYEQAETELATVCAKDPDNGAALFYRGEALNRLGRVEEAIEVLSRSVELAPGNPRAYHTLGVLFDKKCLPERAAPMYRKARELTRR